jgi:hypothetical protein
MRRSSRMLLLIRGHSIVFVVVRPQVLHRRFPSLKVLLVGRRTEVFPLPASDRGYIGAARCVGSISWRNNSELAHAGQDIHPCKNVSNIAECLFK